MSHPDHEPEPDYSHTAMIRPQVWSPRDAYECGANGHVRSTVLNPESSTGQSCLRCHAEVA